MLTVIDYDAGNIMSVVRALYRLGAKAKVTGDADEIKAADKLILPGVGSFGAAMESLKKRGLAEAIKGAVARGKPLLGICLGMQLLFEKSEESPGVGGLGILKGEILKIPRTEGNKIPHMGWDSLRISGGPSNSPHAVDGSCSGEKRGESFTGGRLFRGIKDGAYVYFVHSYYLKAKDAKIVTATCDYGVNIHAAVEKGNIVACQFHPEKSGETGLSMLKNFLEMREKICLQRE